MVLAALGPIQGFTGFLILTVLLLGGVVATGLQAKRPVHLTLVATTVASLGVTIFFAERLGRLFDLRSAGTITPVHLTLAKLTTAAYLLPVFTGLRTLKDATWRPRHRVAAFVVVGMTLVTAVTGTWMILASDRLPTAESSAPIAQPGD